MQSALSTVFLDVLSTSSDAAMGFIIASRLHSSHAIPESKAMLILPKTLNLSLIKSSKL